MEQKLGLKLVLERTLVPEANYTGVIRAIQEHLSYSMEIQPHGHSGIARLPEFNFQGYDISICPGPGFDTGLLVDPAYGDGYCALSNAWYKPLDEVVNEKQQQSLVISGITCKRQQELSYTLYKGLLGVLQKNEEMFGKIDNSVTLVVEPDGKEKVWNAHINARTPSTFASIGVIYRGRVGRIK